MKYLLLKIAVAAYLCIAFLSNGFAQSPLKVGVAGLTHDHVNWIMNRQKEADIEIVGIAEPNEQLAKRYIERYNLDKAIWYRSLDEMLEKTKPEAVCAFNSIYEHLEVVEKCAPLGIHVMVEKPLAVSMEHAEKMKALADKHQIHLLTNYETTWYATNHAIHSIVKEKDSIGDLRKIVIHDGHKGPAEIGCSREFLQWLTDPVMNGGGAIIDFGCYGANLATWLMNNEKPESVMAITQQIKPAVYPKVDDEATIILTYPRAQVIIQASWNWPISRKDIQVYGQKGYVFGDNATALRIRADEKQSEKQLKIDPLDKPYNDPFSYLSGVIRGIVKVKPTDLSSLENNIMVVQILDAARQSAQTGQVVYLK
ncbi:MAG: Gfo/Idh/MocA family oxidoreductase [Cyclobacteriaceae bacterium]|nr:Gfo/Idh/MocA family oxidoreductase [Cyclobacteriaceae bacterium]